MTAGDRVRVLVADDHLVVRLGLVTLIDRERDMRVVAQASSVTELLDLYREHRPDVALMDLHMPGGTGLDAIRAIRAHDPQARIVIITIHGGEEIVYQALRAGAQGYLLKDAPGAEILSAIRTVQSGLPCLPPSVAAAMAQRLRQPDLTPREVRTLKLMARGLPNAAIAERLGISESTVRAEIARIEVKLQARDRAHAVTVALERGVIDLDSLPPA